MSEAIRFPAEVVAHVAHEADRAFCLAERIQRYPYTWGSLADVEREEETDAVRLIHAGTPGDPFEAKALQPIGAHPKRRALYIAIVNALQEHE